MSVEEWLKHEEVAKVIERFRDKIFSLRLSEQINYPLIILQQLQQISAYATYDTELWKRAILELETFIPSSWKDREYQKEIEEIEKIYENTLKEAEKIELDEGWTVEVDEVPYFEARKQALINLLNRLGLLLRPIAKDVSIIPRAKER